jgi:2,4-diketo-3-deoxy-L-fuconate hydrolase
MRIANVADRLCLLSPESLAVDVEDASAGRFSADPQAIYDQWDDFRAWADGLDLAQGKELDLDLLGPVVPRPRQIFAIGMNYQDHAAEIGIPPPGSPSVFTKFQTCLAGPYQPIAVPLGERTDWEVELVVVIGRTCRSVAEEDAWSHVAGLSVGQDVSERELQTRGAQPQFSLGKSLPGFGPIGPWLVSTDEFADPDDLELGCLINGVEVQRGKTTDMVFSVPQLIAELSRTLPLLPGDLIFTGTPAGVGAGRTPHGYLSPGDELVSWVENIGELRNRIHAA